MGFRRKTEQSGKLVVPSISPEGINSNPGQEQVYEATQSTTSILGKIAQDHEDRVNKARFQEASIRFDKEYIEPAFNELKTKKDLEARKTLTEQLKTLDEKNADAFAKTYSENPVQYEAIKAAIQDKIRAYRNRGETLAWQKEEAYIIKSNQLTRDDIVDSHSKMGLDKLQEGINKWRAAAAEHTGLKDDNGNNLIRINKDGSLYSVDTAYDVLAKNINRESVDRVAGAKVLNSLRENNLPQAGQTLDDYKDSMTREQWSKLKEAYDSKVKQAQRKEDSYEKLWDQGKYLEYFKVKGHPVPDPVPITDSGFEQHIQDMMNFQNLPSTKKIMEDKGLQSLPIFWDATLKPLEQKLKAGEFDQVDAALNVINRNIEKDSNRRLLVESLRKISPVHAYGFLAGNKGRSGVDGSGADNKDKIFLGYARLNSSRPEQRINGYKYDQVGIHVKEWLAKENIVPGVGGLTESQYNRILIDRTAVVNAYIAGSENLDTEWKDFSYGSATKKAMDNLFGGHVQLPSHNGYRPLPVFRVDHPVYEGKYADKDHIVRAYHSLSDKEFALEVSKGAEITRGIKNYSGKVFYKSLGKEDIEFDLNKSTNDLEKTELAHFPREGFAKIWYGDGFLYDEYGNDIVINVKGILTKRLDDWKRRSGTDVRRMFDAGSALYKRDHKRQLRKVLDDKMDKAGIPPIIRGRILNAPAEKWKDLMSKAKADKAKGSSGENKFISDNSNPLSMYYGSYTQKEIEAAMPDVIKMIKSHPDLSEEQRKAFAEWLLKNKQLFVNETYDYEKEWKEEQKHYEETHRKGRSWD